MMQNKNKLPSNQQDAVIYARFSSRRQKKKKVLSNRFRSVAITQN